MKLGAYPARARLGGRAIEIVSTFAGARDEWESPGVGRDVLVSWHLDGDSGGGPYAWWAKGHGDAIAVTAAQRCAGLKARGVYVRPWAEFNADWVDFGPVFDFRAAWRRVRTIFRSLAPDVRFIFNPTADTYAETADVHVLWPGRDYVDLHGLDGYNWAREAFGGWRSFDDIFAEQYRRLQRCAPLPTWVCEFGCAERPAIGDKGTWFLDMASVLPVHYPQVSALVAFDVVKEEDWRVDSSVHAAAGFTMAVNHLLSPGPRFES